MIIYIWLLIYKEESEVFGSQKSWEANWHLQVSGSKFNDWPDQENIIQWNKLDIFLGQKMDD